MVTDHLSHSHVYAAVGPRIAAALEWVRGRDLGILDVGRHEIDGDRLFALVSEYTTKPVGLGRWEAHRRYLDLQCLASGRELIGYAPLDTLEPGDYLAEKDISWHEGSGSFVLLEPGRFMLLWPQDGHMPGITVDEAGPVKKIVLKIAV